MKYLKILPLLIIILFASCKLDPSESYYNNVVVPIDESIIPASSLVGEQFNLYAHVSLDNGCWSNIRFFFDTIEDRNFQIFAIADFASKGACADVIVTGDTLIPLSADEPGMYYFRTWMNAYEYELDSLAIVGPVKGE